MRKRQTDRNLGNSGLSLFIARFLAKRYHRGSLKKGNHMKKNISAAIMAALVILCIFISGCSKKPAVHTAEAYYTYEDQFKKAGFTKRTQVMYVAGEGTYTDPEALKEAVGEQTVTGIVEWDTKENKCTSYNLDADGNRVGAVTYTFRYNESKKRIARIGNGYYMDYVYEDGKIASITRYAGDKKTADAQPVMVSEFKYDAEGNNTVVSIWDETDGPRLTYDYKLAYDESGKLITITYVADSGVVESHTDFTYNDKGLITSSSRYGKDNQLLVYTEYSYE